MAVMLTPDLVSAVVEARGEPVRVRDPNTNQDYVLIKAELYERFRDLLADQDAGLNARQVAALIHQAMREDDEADPLLDGYQNYQRKE